MSDELRLPEKLAACEARLAATPLAASRVDRDELMYRAGWAAADAQRAASTQVLNEGAKRGASWVGHFATAAVAASIAVFATLAFRPPGPREMAAPGGVVEELGPQLAVNGPSFPSGERLGNSKQLAGAARAGSRFDLFLAALATGDSRLTGAPLLAERDRALAGQWIDPPSAWAIPNAKAPAPAAKTVWQLLHDVVHPAPPADKHNADGDSAESMPGKYIGRISQGETI